MSDRYSTGIDGLDAITGGYLPQRSYLIRGQPGAGKTVLGLHFLTAEDAGSSLLVNMGEPADQLIEDASSLGFTLDDVTIRDLSPDEETFTDADSYTVFPSSEVEGESLASEITAAVEETDPDRVFVDPMTQLRYLAPDQHQFRRQVLSFLRSVKKGGATVLFTSQDSPNTPDDDLQFMSDGVIHLDRGTVGTIEVRKFRGAGFQPGKHTARISDDGMVVSPRLRPPDLTTSFTAEQFSSGVPELDELLHGGLERGTITLLSGPTGVGKTTIGAQFLVEAAQRDDRSAMYSFEETTGTLLARAEGIDLPLRSMLENETLAIEEYGTRDHSVDEFTEQLRHDVEERGVKFVMIDGIDGFRNGLAGIDRDVIQEVHTIGRYLENKGLTTILVSEVGSITGDFEVTEEDVSYIADNIIVLRYVEVRGELRKTVGVLKKRASDFERTLRELRITENGIEIGEPLSGLRKVLSGTPEVRGDDGAGTDGIE